MRRLRDLFTAAAIATALIALVRLIPDDAPSRISGPAVVLDGDSLEVLGARLRLAGIDAPEARQDCMRDARPWRCGMQATAALRGRIVGRSVVCDLSGTDRYDRHLAECFVDSASLNRWMVREGWAVSYGEFAAEEQEARAAGRGLWSGTFQRPADWRKRRGG